MYLSVISPVMHHTYVPPCLTIAQSDALTRIWSNTSGMKEGACAHWDGDLKIIYELGLGMQEVLLHLYKDRPSLSQFLEWAYSVRISTTAATEETYSDTLSAADLEHWETNGFVVVRKAVQGDMLTSAANAVWSYLRAKPDFPESWYQAHSGRSGMMLTLTQHPALWAVRRSMLIRRAFEQLYGTRALYLVVDKVSFNPPETPSYTFLGSNLHWDTSLTLPVPLRLQGLLYLTDTSAEDGAFHCVPGFHRQLRPWLESLPPGSDPRALAPQLLQPVPVPGHAGDLIIWHSALPHCATPNRGRFPRLVQYLTYLPDGFEDRRAWR
ncbi:MAG: phytanoyl-CoA dioxygenase [Chitinophagaceae bacterium]|nr:MAG: phytanoyl-CoA dioxygenase [Chitinophagaceae bacterium]